MEPCVGLSIHASVITSRWFFGKAASARRTRSIARRRAIVTLNVVAVARLLCS
jgi:hypothetical protein